VKVWPAIVRLADLAVPVFGVAAQDRVEFPLPDDGETVNQDGSLLEAVQGAVKEMEPFPPEVPAVAPVGDNVNPLVAARASGGAADLRTGAADGNSF